MEHRCAYRLREPAASTWNGGRRGPREGTENGSSDLIDTTEMYLRTIFELGEEGIVPRRARLAETARSARVGLLDDEITRQLHGVVDAVLGSTERSAR